MELSSITVKFKENRENYSKFVYFFLSISQGSQKITSAHDFTIMRELFMLIVTDISTVKSMPYN